MFLLVFLEKEGFVKVVNTKGEVEGKLYMFFLQKIPYIYLYSAPLSEYLIEAPFVALWVFWDTYSTSTDSPFFPFFFGKKA